MNGRKKETRPVVNLSVIVVFSSLIAIATFFSIKLPEPLGEITWAPPIYMALSVLAGSGTSFFATAIGSFIGEGLNVTYLGWPAIYAPGIVWARAPEALIIGWARKKGTRVVIVVMVLATIFETLAFFFPDWAFYNYGLFGYTCPDGNVCTSTTTAYVAAAPDLLTLLDLAFIPVALVIIRAARPAFKRLGFE
jgi:uncharacterized membrane protein